MADDTSPSGPAWTAVADAVQLGPGTTVLDVGCGTGGFCALAAARGAVVHGVDAMADRIAVARRRVPSGDFRVELMEQLPWADGSFDVVTGFNAFQYALDVELALTRGASGRPAGRPPGGLQVRAAGGQRVLRVPRRARPGPPAGSIGCPPATPSSGRSTGSASA